MANIDGQPDHAAPVPVVRTVGFSPKMVAAAAWAFTMPFLLDGLSALVSHLAGNPDLLVALPWWVKVPVTAVVSSLAIALAAYRAGAGVVTLESGSRRV